MNSTKKIIALFMAFALIFASLTLSSCEKSDVEHTEGEFLTLVISAESEQKYEIPLAELDTSKGLVCVLDKLKGEGKLDYGITDGFLDFVGELRNDFLTGEYIFIYTSVEKDMDVSQYKKTVEYEGKTLVSSGVGALEMTIEGGAVIYIGTDKF